MKKNTLLLSLAVLVFSCSSDDDSSESSVSTEDLVGVWALVSESDEDGEAYELSECELMNTVTFTAREFTETYIYGFSADDCEEDEEGTFSYVASATIITAGEGGNEGSFGYLVDGSSLILTKSGFDDINENDVIDEGEAYVFVEVYEKQ